MMRAWNARDRFQQGTSFKSWSFTILRNSFLSSLRRKKHTAEWNEEAMGDMLTAAPDQDRHINIADVQRALDKLPPVQREALLLVGAEQMTYEEAAVVCAVPLGTIKSRVNRGRATLARLVEGKIDEDVAA
jgi:RNA polymerase sigma-70 factor (ECF subfamily)